MTKDRKTQLLLIDGHSMAFRAYYALPDSIKAPDGHPVQAIYGFLNMLFRLLEDERPQYLCVAFDEGRPFRHDLFEAYKAGRDDFPEDMGQQVSELRQILGAMNVHQVAGEPFEADDYIATLCKKASDQAMETLVVSGDRDLFGMIDEHSRVLYPIRGIKQSQIYDEAKVEERYGVRTDQLTDFKAMVGDSSDNIPGVKGIGEKGAAKLLQAYGDLDGIYANLDELAAGMRKKLEEGQEMAKLSHALGALRYDVPVELDLDAKSLGYNRDAVAEVMQAFGFNSTIKRIPEHYATR